jgi:hypothetical protein
MIMGQSKLKADDLKTFLSSLSDAEKITYDLTQRLIKNFIKPKQLTGACYRVSILLNRILSKEYDIDSQVVLGWLNDGDNIFISHAWLETNGKKTDLMAERPQVQGVGRGPTIILDHVFKGTSNITYSYHLDKTPEALATDEAMAGIDINYAAKLRVKDAEHAKIAQAISSPEAMDAFLDECAYGNHDYFTYSRFLEIINGAPRNLSGEI